MFSLFVISNFFKYLIFSDNEDSSQIGARGEIIVSKELSFLSNEYYVLNDILLTSTSALALCTSKKIDKERKKPLILNKLISTGISIIAGCSLDILAQKLGNGFVEKFKTVNSNDKKLLKYLEGINVLRPTLIFAFVYYGAIPVLSAFLSDKLSNLDKDKNLNCV